MEQASGIITYSNNPIISLVKATTYLTMPISNERPKEKPYPKNCWQSFSFIIVVISDSKWSVLFEVRYTTKPVKRNCLSSQQLILTLSIYINQFLVILPFFLSLSLSRSKKWWCRTKKCRPPSSPTMSLLIRRYGTQISFCRKESAIRRISKLEIYAKLI